MDIAAAPPSRRWPSRVGTAVLALLAYLPALLSRPGEIPADTKLYLYLDPGRLLGDAAWSWDDRQYAGWVPHQAIGYLWPSGPWFWVGDRLGLPDWVAHRLWIGTLLFAAGAGVRWCARHLGLSAAGALAAALAYQLSPYVLPYISRTSVLLTPWAGLGWLVGITALAVRRPSWRLTAAFGLAVFTIGGINATALAMVAPAPLLVIADAWWRGTLPMRRALRVAAQLGAAAVVVSLWWMVGLAVQGRYGAPVLSFTETLEATSFTSTASEALRGLGYWILYVVDHGVPLTSAGAAHQVSLRVIAAGWALVVTGLAALVVVRWAGRRLAVALVLVGVVLAIGTHPMSDPSPLWSPFAAAPRSTIALALRSSTRAVPLVLLGIALGLGAGVTALRSRGRFRRAEPLALGLVAAVALVNQPALTGFRLADAALIRPQALPAWWTDAAAALDARPPGYRVLQLPGQESAVHRWGTTVDPVLPGLTARPVVTRDWLPLGNPQAMDLLLALDETFQTGQPASGAVATIARLFGADTVAFAGDTRFERFRTTPPGTAWTALQTAEGLDDPVTFGPVRPNTPAAPGVDDRLLVSPDATQPVPQVALFPLEAPVPMIRAKATTVALVGDGAGVVAAAAAALVDGSEALALVRPDGLAALPTTPGAVVVTDTNRCQARHWRGSQDVRGYTEDGLGPAVLRDDPADHRLQVLPGRDGGCAVLAVQEGGVRAVATAYGEPFAYRPEDRAAQAVDGDPATAWRVADRADARGERLRLEFAEPVTASAFRVLQAQDPTATRWITAVDVVTPTGTTRVPLGDASRASPGEQVPVALDGVPWLELRVAATSDPDTAVRTGQTAVGFAEVDVDGRTSREVVVLPETGDVADTTAVSTVLTRWRADPANRARHDPEPRLDRRFTLPAGRTYGVAVEVHVDPNATDAHLAALTGVALPSATTRVRGAPVAAAFAAYDGDPSTAWVTGFGAAQGAAITREVPTPLDVTRVALTVRRGAGLAVPTAATVTVMAPDGTETTASAELRPDAEGRAEIALPRTTTARLVTVRVDATDGASTVDRRTGERIGLPVAVAEIEIDGLPPVALPASIDTGCRSDLLTLDGEPLPVRLTGSTAGLLAGSTFAATGCTASGDAASLVVSGGAHHLVSAATGTSGLGIERVVLSDGRRATFRPPPTLRDISSSRGERRITVGPCPTGCWVITGDGANDGWEGSVDGQSLGPPATIDAGMAGWWLAPSREARTFTARWTPQRTIWIALVLSALAVVACAATVAAAAPALVSRRRGSVPRDAAGDTADSRETFAAGEAGAAGEPWTPTLPAAPVSGLLGRVPVPGPAARWWAPAVGALALGAVVAGPLWGVLAAAVTLVATRWQRPVLPGVVAVAIVAAVAAMYLGRQWRNRPGDGFGWVVSLEGAHRPTLLALVLLAAAVIPRPGRRR